MTVHLFSPERFPSAPVGIIPVMMTAASPRREGPNAIRWTPATTAAPPARAPPRLRGRPRLRPCRAAARRHPPPCRPPRPQRKYRKTQDTYRLNTTYHRRVDVFVGLSGENSGTVIWQVNTEKRKTHTV